MSILVPLDGSTFAEQALPAALGLARRTGAALHLARVHEPAVIVDPLLGGAALMGQMEMELRKQETEYLRWTLGRLRQETTQSVEADLLDGPVVGTLLNEIREKHANWVVLATHGLGPLSRFWLGSVADALVRHAEAPVLLVRPREEPIDLKREVSIRNVLVCLDGSAAAETVLEPAVDVSSAFGVGLTLLRVVKPPLLVGHDPTRAAPELTGQPLTDRMRREAQEYLDRVAARLRSENLQVEVRVVVDARPATAILEESGRRPDTLTAICTHGRGGLARMVLGSVADKVARGGTGLLLVCRPSKE